jgi:hypothetical protein
VRRASDGSGEALTITFLLFSLPPLCCTFLVRGSCQFVLHFTTKASFTAGMGSRRSCAWLVTVSSTCMKSSMAVSLLVARFGRDVMNAWVTVKASKPFSLFGGKGIHVALVVIWVMPDSSWRIRLGINKELVLLLRIKAPNPAFWQRSRLILHAAANLGSDAVPLPA